MRSMWRRTGGFAPQKGKLSVERAAMQSVRRRGREVPPTRWSCDPLGFGLRAPVGHHRRALQAVQCAFHAHEYADCGWRY